MGVEKRQPATSTTKIVKNSKIEVLEMITLMDADSFACACGILGLDVLEQNKGNLKLLLKYILRQLNPDDIESSDDGGFFWYAELHDHLTVSFSKNMIHL